MTTLKAKRIDYVKVYNKKPELSQDKRARLTAVLPFAIIAVLAAVLFGFKYNTLRGLQKQIDADAAYVADAENAKQYSQYLDLYYQYENVTNIKTDLKSVTDALATYPEFGSSLFRDITAAAGGNIAVSSYSYDKTTGLLAVYGSSANVTDAAAFAKALEGVGGIASVTYTGYENDSTGRYYFTMQCLLASAGEGN